MCFFIVIKAEGGGGQSNYTHQRKQPILRASIQSIPLPLECSALIYAHYVTDKSITAHEKQQCCGPCSTTTRAFSAIL